MKSDRVKVAVPTGGSLRGSGFTLVEMLVVIGVVALIVAAMAPMVFSSLSATRLSAAGETVAGQLAYARQRAVAGNHEVEVRFYSYDDPDAAGTESNYYAMGTFKASVSNVVAGVVVQAEQLGDVMYLGSGVAFGASSKLSPIFSSDSTSHPDTERSVARAQATYKSFRFLPDGGTDLASNAAQCYVTLVEDRYAGETSDIPKNFFAIQIDPATGRITTYRP